MSSEPSEKRAIAFVGGQDLYHAAKAAFGYTYPNYDMHKLSESICNRMGWTLTQVRFYTGVPDKNENPMWNGFWQNKLAMMGRQGVVNFTRPLRYRNKTFLLPDGTQHSFLRADEKGIDVRIALA